MCLICKGVYSATALSVAMSGVNPSSVDLGRSREISSKISALEKAEKAISSVSVNIQKPDWYNREVERRNKRNVIVEYSVATKGNIRSDLAEFRRQIQETLTDSRGWARDLAFSSGKLNLAGDSS